MREWSLVEVDVAVRGFSPDAAEGIGWFWRNGYFVERHREFIARARDWCQRPELAAVLERLLPARPVRDAEGRFPELMDWLALMTALRREAAIAAWFDERVAAGDSFREEQDVTVALWRHVAARARPDQLERIDAAIASAPRAPFIARWVARPVAEVCARFCRQ